MGRKCRKRIDRYYRTARFFFRLHGQVQRCLIWIGRRRRRRWFTDQGADVQRQRFPVHRLTPRFPVAASRRCARRRRHLQQLDRGRIHGCRVPILKTKWFHRINNQDQSTQHKNQSIKENISHQIEDGGCLSRISSIQRPLRRTRMPEER